MTFYGSERPIEYGPQSFFDPTMAQMVLNANNNYINAVYQDYLRGREDLKEFNEKYGGFTSPIAADMEDYYGEIDKVQNAVNQMYNNGDLLRTQEGRAALAQIINSVNRNKLAVIKQSAKEREAYDEMVRKMKATGTYNEDFARWQFMRTHGGIAPEDWRSSVNGTWGMQGPTAYQDLNAATKSWYDQMQKGYIGTDPDGFELWGNTPEDVRQVMRTHLPDLTGDYWDYQRDLASRQLGPNATPEQIQAQLENNLVAAAAEKYTRPELRESAARKREQELYNQKALYDYKAAVDRNEENLKNFDLDLDGTLNESEREFAKTTKQTAATGGKKGQHNIFREADRNYYNTTPTDYNVSKTRELKINPLDGRIKLRQDKKSKNWGYDIPADAINNVLYSHDSVYGDGDFIKLSNFRKSRNGEQIEGGTYQFIPKGNIKAKYDKKQSRMRYFISGTLRHGGEDFTYDDGTPRTYEMEIKERDFSYEQNK